MGSRTRADNSRWHLNNLSRDINIFETNRVHKPWTATNGKHGSRSGFQTDFSQMILSRISTFFLEIGDGSQSWEWTELTASSNWCWSCLYLAKLLLARDSASSTCFLYVLIFAWSFSTSSYIRSWLFLSSSTWNWSSLHRRSLFR